MKNKIMKFCCQTLPFIVALVPLFAINVFAVDDMWVVADRIIVDVYNHIAGISTVPCGSYDYRMRCRYEAFK